MVAGLVCQSSVNGQSDRQPARMRFVGGFSPDGQGQRLEAERQPRAKQGAGTGRKTGRNRKEGKTAFGSILACRESVDKILTDFRAIMGSYGQFWRFGHVHKKNPAKWPYRLYLQGF